MGNIVINTVDYGTFVSKPDESCVFKILDIIRMLEHAAKHENCLYRSVAESLYDVVPISCNFNVRSENIMTWNLYHELWINTATHETPWYEYEYSLSEYRKVDGLRETHLVAFSKKHSELLKKIEDETGV